MSDLIQRLRGDLPFFTNPQIPETGLDGMKIRDMCKEAADEVERLRQIILELADTARDAFFEGNENEGLCQINNRARDALGIKKGPPAPSRPQCPECGNWLAPGVECDHLPF